MSRIRTIKPDLWTSEEFVSLTPMARILYIGMWNFCDDAGIYPASAKTLKMQVLPGDLVAFDQVQAYVQEMLDQRMLLEFEGSDGKTYWKVVSWETDQKIDRPVYRYPTPNSSNHRRALGAYSSSPRRALGEQTPPEGNGREGKGKEGREGEDAPANFSKNIIAPNAVPNPDGLPSKTSEFDATLEKVENWARSNADAVKGWVAKMRYDVEKFGPAWHQIPKFVGHYLKGKRPGDREGLLQDPEGFFRLNFASWLGNCDNFDKPKGNNKGAQGKAEVAYSPPATRTSADPVGKTRAKHWLGLNYPGQQVNESDLPVFSRCCSDEEMSAVAIVKFGGAGPPARAVVVPMGNESGNAKVVSL